MEDLTYDPLEIDKPKKPEKSDAEVECKEAYNYSIYLLSKRDYSNHKLTQKLKTRKYSKENIEKVIQKVTDQGYLREEAYTTMRIKTLLYKGYANYFIKQKLAQEFLEVDDARIDQLRGENHISKDESINYLIDKKLRYKEIPKDKAEFFKLKDKVIRFLISKGHDYSSAKSLLEEYLDTKKPWILRVFKVDYFFKFYFFSEAKPLLSQNLNSLSCLEQSADFSISFSAFNWAISALLELTCENNSFTALIKGEIKLW